MPHKQDCPGQNDPNCYLNGSCTCGAANDTCFKCRGRGSVRTWKKCDDCNGEGKIWEGMRGDFGPCPSCGLDGKVPGPSENCDCCDGDGLCFGECKNH